MNRMLPRGAVALGRTGVGGTEAHTMRVLVLLLLLTALADPQPRAELVFKVRGEPIEILTLAELQKRLPTVALTLHEPHELAPRVYKAFALEPLLREVYGTRWQAHDELLVTCWDGYQPSVPGPYIHAHKGYLAYASADGKPFELHTQTKGVQPAGPFYLVWDNLTDKSMHPDESHYWPYQVHVLDIISFDARFANTSPPPNASAAARRGFTEFRRYCLMCHAINGQGGTQAELNYPVNITEYYDLQRLDQWIKDPQSIRDKAEMKGLFPELPERDRVVSDIIEYLKAMKDRKIDPAGK